jgi:hypothetical protein
MADLNFQINVQGNAGEAIGSLKKQLREAQNEVAALSDKFGATSKEAIEAAKRASDLKDRIGDAKALTDAFNPDAKFKALTASLSGVAGGFAAVQGAIGLFGGEAKEVEKAILKVQSALALSQGLQAIGESIDSFKQLGAVIQNSTAFIKLNELANKAAAAAMKLFGVAVETTSTSFKVLKGAIAATGIGLLVVAVGEIISAFQSWTTESEKAKAAQDKLNESISKGAKIGLDSALSSLENQRKIAVAQAKLRGASEKELFDIEQSFRKLRGEAQVRYWEEIKNADKEGAIKARDEVSKINTEGKVADLEFQAKELERKRDEAKKKREAQEAEEKRLEDGRKAARKAGFDFDMMVLDNQEKAKEKAKADAEQQAKDDDDEVARLFALEEEKTAVIIEASNKRLLIEKAFNEAEIKAQYELQDAKFAAASAGINLLGSLVGQNEKLANTLFVIDKALAIGKIIVDTQREIAGYAASNSIFGPAGIPLTASMSLAAKIRAGASIATIAATTISKFKGGAASANFGSGGAISTTGVPIVPQQAQAQLTQLNSASINALGNQAIKAYVVETDVTSNQQRIKAIQQRARFD